MDDAALFEAWVGGDQAAGETLYRRHFDGLYRFFRPKAPDDYEDLIQNTLLECVRSRGRYRGEAPFRAYLYGVARHRLLHYLRAKGSNRLEFDGEHNSVADVDPRPSTVVARRAEHRLLLEAMRRIPVDLQVALELHYWEEFDPCDSNAATSPVFSNKALGSQGFSRGIRLGLTGPDWTPVGRAGGDELETVGGRSGA
ncbi:RNA polymerase sigma factor [Paraliomyxa miuraensis]|uniref:RNA polymerase sigma factor n=1 Tax=Paraliomyxa miuraensis TaxID=376150 RepID=UPI00224F1485|nr:sigma-70 family RNA polymerase sigma factor [Paraliomyxa miuraensis]MCX4248106.1 sigma-70 family RNA polymerase sigma factor [Paraliomyxa miuraensis]